MPKLPLWEKSSDTIHAIAGGGDMGVLTFLKGISLKVERNITTAAWIHLL